MPFPPPTFCIAVSRRTKKNMGGLHFWDVNRAGLTVGSAKTSFLSTSNGSSYADRWARPEHTPHGKTRARVERNLAAHTPITFPLDLRTP